MCVAEASSATPRTVGIVAAALIVLVTCLGESWAQPGGACPWADPDSTGQCCGPDEIVDQGICTTVVTPGGIPFEDLCFLYPTFPGCGNASGGTGGGGGTCGEGECGEEEDNEEEDNDGNAGSGQVDAAWVSGAKDAANCIAGKVSEVSEIQFEIEWGTVGPKGAKTECLEVSTPDPGNPDGPPIVNNELRVTLDYDVLSGQARMRTRKSVLYEKMVHEYVHLWRMADTQCADGWGSHTSDFWTTEESFKNRSRFCE